MEKLALQEKGEKRGEGRVREKSGKGRGGEGEGREEKINFK